jgi:long-chain acyl-CoA synthetase
VREFSTPQTVDIPRVGNLTDDVVANARDHATAAVLPPTRPGRLDRRDRGRVPRRGQRRGQGPGRRRHRARRPGRPALEDPLRVDAPRLRDLVRRRGHGADLRDLVGRAGRLDPRRLRRRAVVVEGAAPRRRRSPRSARETHPSSSTCGTSTTTPRRAGPARRRGRRRRARDAAYNGDSARPGHADLHLGHHRPPQGLHAHPRQLHVRARRRGERAGPSSSGRGRLDAALPAAGARLRADHPGRLRQGPRAARPLADIKNLVADLGEFQPTFVLAVPRVFEKVFNTASQRAGRRQGQDLRPRRRDRHRLVAGEALDTGRSGAARIAASTRSSTAGLRQAPRGARRQVPTPSPAAHRWATGSATSTAASASPCSRATASPRRPPR